MKLSLDHVNYIYSPGTAFEKQALRDISFEIGQGEFVALAGSTGSGKTTLVQLINGLKRPTSGNIYYDGELLHDDKKKLRQLRCRVGLVFQYPEYQLFDETVIKDVSFGPKNKGLSAQDAREKAGEALVKAGLSENTFEKSPFDLSGGEKRRVAIAGVIAMEPDVLVLDEPTAGLDPQGKINILELIKSFQTQNNVTVIMVTHNMDEAAEYADRMIVMDEGRVIMDDDTHKVFAQKEKLYQAGLSIPQAASLCERLGIKGAVTINEAVSEILGRYCR